MNISARIANRTGENMVRVTTAGRERSLVLPPKEDGSGSSVNGGELLFLALATCYCNDLYREARKRGIELESVEVEVEGQFGGEGEPARDITYRAQVLANASEEDIEELMRHTDAVAEIHNTLRRASSVTLVTCKGRESQSTRAGSD
jgi:uncharacterized OsmC-like protein